MCSGDKWKWFVGKKTVSPYVSSEGLEAYKKVMEFTCVDGNRVRESSGRMEELEREVEELREQMGTIMDMLAEADKKRMK